MNRSRMLTLAVIAFTVAVGVTLVIYRALRDRLQPNGDMTEIVVAAQTVPLGSRLTEADLRLAPWPRAIPIQGSFQKLSDVVGRGVIVPMISNEPILDSKLAATGGGAGLPAAIPDGMRAVGVKVNDVIGVAGFVAPGSRVDVILSGSPVKNNEIEMSKVILENIQVLAAGQNVTSDANGKPQSVQVVTLLVTPDESQKLALGSVDGKIQLALRNPLDLNLTNPDVVRREALFASSTPAPAPASASAPEPKRTVARAPVPKPAPTPAPAAVVATLPPPAPPAKVELQLILGSKSQTISFDKKTDVAEGPASQ
jgi:pilus assembly protein CpaB